MKRFLLDLLLLLSIFLFSCSSDNYDEIPRNGFITHWKKTDPKQLPFDSCWNRIDPQEWDARLAAKTGRVMSLYIMPVTLDYLEAYHKMGPREARNMQALAAYFDKALHRRFGELAARDPRFRLSEQPDRESYILQIGILYVQRTRIAHNMASTAADTFVAHGSSLVLSRKKDNGAIAMGARFYGPHRRLLAEMADFEYGKKSLPGYVAVDFKDFARYAYQRHSIDEWCRQLVQLFSSRYDQPVRRRSFYLNPF